MKPRITRLLDDKGNCEWYVLLLDGNCIGWKEQTFFRSFGAACLIARCSHGIMG